MTPSHVAGTNSGYCGCGSAGAATSPLAPRLVVFQQASAWLCSLVQLVVLPCCLGDMLPLPLFAGLQVQEI